MKLKICFLLLALCGLTAPVHAQIQPLPTVQPKPTLLWLASLSLSPTSVTQGNTVTGTVTLLRAALSDMTISLSLSGATAVEGNIFAADGAVMPGTLKIPAGSSKATFVISTSKPTSTTGSKTYTVNAMYGNEKLTSSFTTNPPLVKSR